jgi:glycosyltransferase involved in cell wall biosynthesis
MADTAASVVIPCHSNERRARLAAAVESVLAQRPAPAKVIVAVDYNDSLLAHARATMPGVTVVANQFNRGVCGTRNTGVLHTDTPFVALLDDDGWAQPGWLAALTAPFEDPTVVGTAGVIEPTWEDPRPSWFPDEFLWAVTGTFPVPDVPTPVRNAWGATMAVRRETFDAVGGFRLGYGRLGDGYRPEDTDLGLRMSKVNGGRWILAPDSRINHPVPRERATLRYLLGRCFKEGRGKIELGRLHEWGDSFGSERDYLSRTLPRAVARGVGNTLRGRGLSHAARAGVVLLGASVAAAGGLTEMLRPHPDPQVAAAMDTEVSRDDAVEAAR